MKRTILAFLVFAITSAAIIRGSLTIKEECDLLSKQVETILSFQDISDEDIYKLEQSFGKNSLLWAAILGNEQKNEMEKTLKQVKRLLHTSDEEGRSLLYTFMLDIQQMGKNEQLNLENII